MTNVDERPMAKVTISDSAGYEGLYFILSKLIGSTFTVTTEEREFDAVLLGMGEQYDLVFREWDAEAKDYTGERTVLDVQEIWEVEFL